MNQKTVIGILIVLVVIGGIFALSNKGQEKEAMMDKDTESDVSLAQDDKAMAEKEVMKKDGENPIEVMDYAKMPAGIYESYSPEKIAQKAETGNVVLFFRASWCPTCRALDKDVRANENSIPKDLTILDVDYDNSQDLKKKYGVTYQHTLVEVDKDGKLIKKWMGSPTLASLVKEII